MDDKAKYNSWKYGPVELRGLNPEFKPWAEQARNMTTDSMEHDKFYDEHTREECAAEWRKRYESFSKRFA